MKVAVINFSGNVGKTTVAAHLLKPRMQDAPVFSVESLNIDGSADGLQVEKVRGKRFSDLQQQVLQLGSAIIDVGASNVESFVTLMQQFDGSHEDFDCFLVPAVKERKPLGDTVNTIRALAKLGVPADKIRVVMNKVEPEDSVQADFAPLIGLAESERSFVFNPSAVIYANEVFELLKGMGKTLGDITDDQTDYKALLPGAKTQQERDQYARMVGIKRASVSAKRNMDTVYSALFA